MAPGSRTPAEAVEHYRGRTARLLACVTNEHVVVSAYHAADPPHQLELSDLAKLRAAHPLRLSVGEHYEVREDADGWRIEVVGYNYAIEHDGRDLVSYHWHPQGESPITWPHMHAGTDIHVGGRWFGKAICTMRPTRTPRRSSRSCGATAALAPAMLRLARRRT